MNCAGFELFNSELQFPGSSAWGRIVALWPCLGFQRHGPVTSGEGPQRNSHPELFRGVG